MPIGNPMIYDAYIDLGYEGNMFSMLGESVDNFMSLSYLRGMFPLLTLIVYA